MSAEKYVLNTFSLQRFGYVDRKKAPLLIALGNFLREEGEGSNDLRKGEHNKRGGRIKTKKNFKLIQESEEREVFTSLSPIQQKVLGMRYYRDLSRKEIACELDLSVSGVGKIETEALNTLLNRISILKAHPDHPGFIYVAKKRES